MQARRRLSLLDAAHHKRASNLFDLAPARRAALGGELARVADLLPGDPDAAALLLDGLLQRLGAEWFRTRHRAVPQYELLLGVLERDDAPFSWRLRLALRGPDVHARVVAARQCLVQIHNQEADE